MAGRNSAPRSDGRWRTLPPVRRHSSAVTIELDQVEPAKTALANKDKAKASTDGEDVIAPLVQKAAGDVIATATQKQ